VIHHNLTLWEYLLDNFDNKFIQITNYSFDVCSLIESLNFTAKLSEYPVDLILVFMRD